MSDESKKEAKYVVHHAVQSAIGDYARVNNYFPPQTTEKDNGAAELRQLFAQVNEQLAALAEADRDLVTPAIQQAAQATAEIQQGDESPEKQSFLEKRLKAIYNMREDIGQVIIVTLANPAAGIAVTLQKIAKKVKDELGINV